MIDDKKFFDQLVKNVQVRKHFPKTATGQRDYYTTDY